MELNTKDIGKIIRRMEEVSIGMQMEMCMMESGEKIKHTDMEYIFMLMEQNMKVSGNLICNMEKVLSNGQTDLNMMVDTKKE